VFFGEYAAQSDYTVSVKNRNNLECALSEAACMTGLERNGDVVRMASYAPLFANADAWQWTPDLIWVNTLGVYRTPNYYVQQLYSRNHGDVVLPVKLDAASGAKLFASATRDNASGEIILKVVNGDRTPAAVQLNLAGLGGISGEAKLTVLAGEPNDENSFATPQNISPKQSVLKISGAEFQHEFPANSFTVLRVK
jgi:alpha-N-arabinofuranosidase